MTWLKLSDDFGDACADLSDAGFRTHVEGLGWAMRRQTKGRLSHRDIRRFAETDDPESAVLELLDKGFWERDGAEYRIVHHMEHQPEPEVLAHRRKLAAERQRKARRKKVGLPPYQDTESRSESRRDNTRDPGRDGSGRAGTGYQGSGSTSTRASSKYDEWLAEYDQASNS